MRASAPGAVFTPSQFLDFASRAAVDKALSRLAKAGRIRRVGRGLYDLPRHHPILGELSPNADAVAASIAKKRGARLQASEAVAANLLGLSEQVPAKRVYLTDARMRPIHLGKTTIAFRQRSTRQMALAGKASALIISALRSFSKDNIPTAKLQQLHAKLPEKERRQLLRNLPLAPAWMHPHLRLVATGQPQP